MRRKCFLFSLLAVVTRIGVCDINGLVPETVHLPHYATLDPAGKYHFFWNFDDVKIVFEVQVQTLGYVGLGLSPNGDMPGSDIVIGGVYGDGKVYFQDRHATAKQEPVVDEQQDWFLAWGSQNDTHTTLRFWRMLKTCDEFDRPLESETARVIWAYSDVDADSEGTVQYHTTNRGSKSIYLLNPQKTLPKIPEDSLIFDILNNRVHVPDLDTTYWCQGFAIPEVDRKHHVIKIEPKVEPGHEALVHHVVLFACDDNSTKELIGHGAECYGDYMKWLSCTTSVFAWAVGGGPFYFPEHVGLPIGFDGDPAIFMLQTHYDNPSLRNDYVDSSGLRLTLSSMVRTYDAATLAVGVDVSSLQIIPPYEESFRSDGHCVSECLTQGMEGNAFGIRIFAGFLHAHLLGTAMRFRHFRNGVEQKPIMEDTNYDFNFQETRVFEEESTVVAGDNLLTQCYSKSIGKTNVTYGGLSTREEMCVTFALYYPRMQLSNCYSSNDVDILTDFAGVTLFSNFTVNEPIEHRGLRFRQVFDQLVDWKDKSVRERFQDLVTNPNNPIRPDCFRNADDKYPITEKMVPKITKEWKEPDVCKTLSSGSIPAIALNTPLIVLAVFPLLVKNGQAILL